MGIVTVYFFKLSLINLSSENPDPSSSVLLIDRLCSELEAGHMDLLGTRFLPIRD